MIINIMTKMTVPNNPVTALNGISESVNVLERISTAIMNVPPKVTHKGIVLFASLPTSNLTMWGMIKPTQEIVPQKQTEMAVRTVDKIITNNL